MIKDGGRKRLAIYLPHLESGGVERVLVNLAEALSARGVSVDLVLGRAEGPFLDQIAHSVHVVDLKCWYRGGGRTFASLPALARYLKRSKPDVLLTGLHRANLVALLARRLSGISVQVVTTVHSVLSAEREHFRGWYLRSIFWLSRRLYPFANGIVAVSQGVADEVARVFQLPRDRIHVIYNVALTVESRKRAQADLDHPWFEKGSPPVVLSVGRLEDPKDFVTLIHAFAKVRTGRQARLIILGEGYQREQLEALARELGFQDDISLPGFVDNPYPYMKRAAVFVLSSRWEALPTVLAEALYCGVPVIATNCPCGPREILQDGKYGSLVPVGDPEALARAMEEALDHPPKCPDSSWQPFTQDVVADKYLDLLFGEDIRSSEECAGSPAGLLVGSR